jgi:hypothetical protein
VLALATERLAAILIDGWPQVDVAELRLLADSLVRLAISHAALSAGPPERSAATVSKILGPYVDSLLAQASCS